MNINKEDKVIVTGGTGFLGSHILRGLIELGYKNVFALKRSTSGMSLIEDIESKITWVEGDVLDIIALENLFEGASFVIHSAAKVSYNPSDADAVYKVNVEGTANMVNCALACQSIKKFIFVSSVAAVGRPRAGKLISESTEWSDNHESTNYGHAKHLAELEVWRGMTEGLKVGVINPSMILGPSYWGDSSTKLFTYVADQKQFYPIGKNGFVDVRDVAKMAILYMESSYQGERVLVVSETYTYQKLLRTIAKEMGLKAPSKPLSPWLGKIIWRLTSFQKDPAITKETVSITSGQFSYDNSKSLENFDFSYRNVESSIKDTVQCFKESKEKKILYSFFDKIFD